MIWLHSVAAPLWFFISTRHTIINSHNTTLCPT